MAKKRAQQLLYNGYYDPDPEDYDPQLAGLAAAAAPAIGAAIPVARKVGGAVYRTGRRAALSLTAGLRRPPPVVYVSKRTREGYARMLPWLRVGILFILWLTGIYLIRQLLKNWILGGLAWVAGVGVDFAAESRVMTAEEVTKFTTMHKRAPTPSEMQITDIGKILSNSFLNPLALLWTVVFILLLMNALPEVAYTE